MLSIRIRRQQIPRQMFANKLVKWLVLVERADDIVAESPSIRKHHAASATGRFSKARHIQPMSAPAFSVARRFEQSVHRRCDGSIGVRQHFFGKLLLFFQSWCESGQDKGQTAK